MQEMQKMRKETDTWLGKYLHAWEAPTHKSYKPVLCGWMPRKVIDNRFSWTLGHLLPRISLSKIIPSLFPETKQSKVLLLQVNNNRSSTGDFLLSTSTLTQVWAKTRATVREQLTCIRGQLTKERGTSCVLTCVRISRSSQLHCNSTCSKETIRKHDSN